MSEPDYEAEDIGCECQSDDPECLDVESEWEWQEDGGYYECTGCGDMQ
jgi:hypothetical protein